MRDALNAFVIRGVSTNIPFQAALMQHPRFVSGRLQHRPDRRGVPQGVPLRGRAARRSDAADLRRRRDPPRYMRARGAASPASCPATSTRSASDWIGRAGRRSARGHGDNDRGPSPASAQRRPLQGRDVHRAVGLDVRPPDLPRHDQRPPVCMQVERRNLHYRLFHWGSQVDIMVLTARAAELYALMPQKRAARSLAVPDLADARPADRVGGRSPARR